MRVYLFADFGKGPVYQRSWQHPAHLPIVFDRPGADLSFEPAREARSARSCRRILRDSRRWWLVECESADAGRAIIENDARVRATNQGVGDHRDIAARRAGRILDSGGAA